MGIDPPRSSWGGELIRNGVAPHARSLGARGPHPRPERLGDAPRLRDAPARRVRRLGVEDLADRAEARLAEVRDEAVEAAPRAREVARVELQPCVDVRAREEGPDRPLVVRRVARAE